MTALGIQAGSAPETAFTATQTTPNQVEMSDGTTSCHVWLGPQEGFDGAYAFVLREGRQVTALGLCGNRLDCEAGRIELRGGGQLILRRKTDAGHGWEAECEPSEKWTMGSPE